MKKFVLNLLSLSVALIVFLTGAGVTIVNYCCSSCSGQTLLVTGQHTCCLEQEQDTKPQSCCSHKEISPNTCGQVVYTNNSHCSASRLSIDIDASSFRPHVVMPFVWIADTSFITAGSLLPEKVVADNDYICFKSPPDIPPREYLSLIRVLII